MRLDCKYVFINDQEKRKYKVGDIVRLYIFNEEKYVIVEVIKANIIKTINQITISVTEIKYKLMEPSGEILPCYFYNEQLQQC